MSILLTYGELRASCIGKEMAICDATNVSKAQLKKLVNIIRRDYPETLFLLEDLTFWHELLKEIE